MPAEEETPTEQTFVPVHVCLRCGKSSRRADVEGAPTPSGIFRCSVCGYEGPLNIEIRGLDEGAY